jgi:repressor LexA
MTRLAEKQRSFYQGIKQMAQESGRFPSYTEMQRAFGFSSPNSVTQNLQALEAKGYLKQGERGRQFTEPRICPHCAGIIAEEVQ